MIYSCQSYEESEESFPPPSLPPIPHLRPLPLFTPSVNNSSYKYSSTVSRHPFGTLSAQSLRFLSRLCSIPTHTTTPLHLPPSLKLKKKNTTKYFVFADQKLWEFSGQLWTQNPNQTLGENLGASSSPKNLSAFLWKTKSSTR